MCLCVYVAESIGLLIVYSLQENGSWEKALNWWLGAVFLTALAYLERGSILPKANLRFFLLDSEPPRKIAVNKNEKAFHSNPRANLR